MSDHMLLGYLKGHLCFNILGSLEQKFFCSFGNILFQIKTQIDLFIFLSCDELFTSTKYTLEKL